MKSFKNEIKVKAKYSLIMMQKQIINRSIVDPEDMSAKICDQGRE